MVVQVRQVTGGYQLRAGVLTASGTTRYTSWASMSDAPHPVVVRWAAGSSGSLSLSIDGAAATVLTGLANSTMRIEEVRLRGPGLEHRHHRHRVLRLVHIEPVAPPLAVVARVTWRGDDHHDGQQAEGQRQHQQRRPDRLRADDHRMVIPRRERGQLDVDECVGQRGAYQCDTDVGDAIGELVRPRSRPRRSPGDTVHDVGPAGVIAVTTTCVTGANTGRRVSTTASSRSFGPGWAGTAWSRTMMSAVSPVTTPGAAAVGEGR